MAWLLITQSFFVQQYVMKVFRLKSEKVNEETNAALAEYETMKNDPYAYKRYDSFDELLCEVITDA